MKLRFLDKMPTVNLQCPGLKRNHRSIILLGEQCNNSFRGVWKVNLIWTWHASCALHCTFTWLRCESIGALLKDREAVGGTYLPVRTVQKGRAIALGAWRPFFSWCGWIHYLIYLVYISLELLLWSCGLGATICQFGTDHPLPVCEGVPPLSH